MTPLTPTPPTRRLPAIDIPAERAPAVAYSWAYRIATLPYGASVDDVAILIQAAICEAAAQETK